MSAHAGIVVAATLIAVAACGPKPAPARTDPAGDRAGSARDAGGTTGPSDPGESKDSLAAAVERNVEMLEAIAGLPSTLTCKDAAVRIDGLTRERSADLATVRAAIAGAKSAEVDAMYADASGRLADVMVKLDALVARCAADAELTAALGRLSMEGP